MTTPTIAYFITPHGYGHATRSAAVMAALETRLPEVRFEIFTTCPAHLFGDSLRADFGYHPMVTDIGMVQTSPLIEDPEATCRQLDSWLPFDPTQVQHTARLLKHLNCELVVSDISPLGIAVAQQAGRPVVLVENFTWDWIYQFYLPQAPGLQPHIDYLVTLFKQADHHIQATPICRPTTTARQVAPISRAPRSDRCQVRRQLQIPESAKMVLVSMGGVPDAFDFLEHLPTNTDLYLVVAGADGKASAHKRVIGLPAHSDFFHPDLMQAADVLVGKVGYSTVAEAYHAHIPFGYICRPEFAESATLEKFICQHLPALSIAPDAYRDGSWLDILTPLLNVKRKPLALGNGADAVARIIQKVL